MSHHIPVCFFLSPKNSMALSHLWTVAWTRKFMSIHCCCMFMYAISDLPVLRILHCRFELCLPPNRLDWMVRATWCFCNWSELPAGLTHSYMSLWWSALCCKVQICVSFCGWPGHTVTFLEHFSPVGVKCFTSYMMPVTWIMWQILALQLPALFCGDIFLFPCGMLCW